LELKELSEASGVSGCEEEIRKIIQSHIENWVDEIRVDSLGNLTAIKNGTRQSHRVMLAAHMDEVGLMITSIEKDGGLRFSKVGGIDDRVLLSKVVLIGAQKVPGVIGAKPPHLLKKEEKKQVVKVDQMFIDIGASDKEEAEKMVKVGDYATFYTRYEDWGTVVKGKAFDDRAGCAVLMEVLKENFPFTVNGVFTVQEEVGIRGARVAAYRLDPVVAFVLEGTTADDIPKKKDLSPCTVLAKGPALSYMDQTVICDRQLFNFLVSTAEKNRIPFQIKQLPSGGTDGGAIHLTRSGIPVAVISVPCRYIHSPATLLHKEDFSNTVKLIVQALHRFKKEFIK